MKHACLNPLLHLAIFIASFGFKTKMTPGLFTYYFADRPIDTAPCEEVVNNYQDLVIFFQAFHIFAFFIQLFDLISKGSGASSENCCCGPRITGIIALLMMIVVVGYHGMMAVLLKRVNAYSESQAVCQANFESLGLPFSDKEKRDIFGELFLFLTFEAFIFFAQILSLPLWMLRSRLSAT